MPIPRRIWIFLAIGVPALSQSANIIRLGDAHPIAIAAWRLALASAVLAPLAGRGCSRLTALGSRELWLLAFAGVALALHLFTWIAAVQSTTVANATLIFATNPVITAGAAYLLFGERSSRGLKAAIALGVLGVGAIGWNDLALEPSHLSGDGLAVISSFLFTAYLLVGKRVRPKLDTNVYVTAVYGVAALTGFCALAAAGEPFFDYSRRTWLCFGLMAVVPTLIGHTSLNAAVKYLPAGRITALTLSEPLLAGAVAALVWDEIPSLGALAGYVLIGGSVLITVIERKEKGEAHP